MNYEEMFKTLKEEVENRCHTHGYYNYTETEIAYENGQQVAYERIYDRMKELEWEYENEK